MTKREFVRKTSMKIFALTFGWIIETSNGIEIGTLEKKKKSMAPKFYWEFESTTDDPNLFIYEQADKQTDCLELVYNRLIQVFEIYSYKDCKTVDEAWIQLYNKQ